MSDFPQTPEAVAYALMREIASAEGMALGHPPVAAGAPDRKWILETYAECLKCVRIEIVKAAPTHGRSSF